ncbi:sugar phosphate isomerase/epimerase family protein [Leifsonia sp. NPDC058194]|uniref:sugar phosphate isomerase/epimerase family protein n=1 Tax=Leifsonia sp. NPDC058194 TaxID=3346374 RepID=UPI0036D8C6D7
MVQHNIKRGVSLYSYQEEIFLGKLDLESAIAASASFGARGIEIIPEQSYDNFPNLTDQQIAEWFGLHEKYGTTPTAYDMFIDLKRRKDRLMTIDEGVESLVRDIKLANKLGCKVIRVIINTPPEVFEKAAPYAEEYDVKLAVEIHSPMRYDQRWVLPFIDVIHKVDNGYLGLLPDMGTFVRKFPRIQIERALRDGATPKLVDKIVKVYNDHEATDLQVLPVEINWAGGNPADLALANAACMYNWVDPKTMLPHMPYLFHIQAKFYEMLDDETEYSIPYDEIIPVLIEGGYNGYLSSEYEGNRHIQDIHEVDSVEQVRRQHAMFAKLLGETQA